jgi:DnaJ-class molecular chaperone
MSGLVDLQDLVGLLDRVHADLDVLSAYNLLGVAPDATEPEIRQAYHQRALLLHPDRFYSLPDRELRERIGAVYKRVAEAYRVLSQPESRAGYDLLLSQGRVRYDPEAAEQALQQARAAAGGGGAGAGAAEGVHDPQARRFYNLGKAELRRQEFSAAVSSFEQALSRAPDSAKIRAALEEARRLVKLYGPAHE